VPHGTLVHAARLDNSKIFTSIRKSIRMATTKSFIELLTESPKTCPSQDENGIFMQHSLSKKEFLLSYPSGKFE
jgi:hypothetical protein